MNSYFRFFKIKDLNLQVILTNDMYETQKKYGFSEEKIRSLDEILSTRRGIQPRLFVCFNGNGGNAFKHSSHAS